MFISCFVFYYMYCPAWQTFGVNCPLQHSDWLLNRNGHCTEGVADTRLRRGASTHGWEHVCTLDHACPWHKPNCHINRSEDCRVQLLLLYMVCESNRFLADQKSECNDQDQRKTMKAVITSNNSTTDPSDSTLLQSFYAPVTDNWMVLLALRFVWMTLSGTMYV